MSLLENMAYGNPVLENAHSCSIKSENLLQLQEGKAAASTRTAAAPPLGVASVAPANGCSVEVASSQRWMGPAAPLGPSPPTSRKLLPKRTVEAP